MRVVCQLAFLRLGALMLEACARQPSVSDSHFCCLLDGGCGTLTAMGDCGDDRTVSSCDACTYSKADDFERSDVEGQLWSSEYSDNPWSAQISNQYARTGERSLRMELRKTDPIVADSKRSEVLLDPEDSPLEEHWYHFSVLLPDGGDEDFALDPEGSEIIAQWHNLPDPGEEWTMPPLALHTWTQGRYRLDFVWDAAPLSTDAEIEAKGQHQHHEFGSYLEDKGKWVDWSFHVKWGWTESQTPLLEVYRDGVLVVERNGMPNMTHDLKGVYFKLGIYKWDWAPHQEPDNSILDRRVVYYDNVRIR